MTSILIPPKKLFLSLNDMEIIFFNTQGVILSQMMITLYSKIFFIVINLKLRTLSFGLCQQHATICLLTRNDSATSFNDSSLEMNTVPFSPHVSLQGLSWNDWLGKSSFYGFEKFRVAIGVLLKNVPN